MLPLRKLGNQGFECAAQGLGCMGMSYAYGDFKSEAAEAESINVIKRASEIPNLMLDTSDMYGPHTNEKLIGRALKSIGENTLKIGTKFGVVFDANGQMGLDCSFAHVKEACQASLDRLGIDCIDLYYLHRYDLKTPIEETMRALKELVEEGKIKYVGVSELSVENLRRAHAVHPITAYQLEWSLFSRDVETDLVPVCRELGIGIVAYSPLGRGFLSGAIKSIDDIPETDARRNFPWFKENLENNIKLVEIVQKVAEAKGCAPGQVALAWVHAQGEDVVPIPGTKKVTRFEENIAAFDIKLTEDEMDQLNYVAQGVKGDRYPERSMLATYKGLQAKMAIQEASE